MRKLLRIVIAALVVLAMTGIAIAEPQRLVTQDFTTGGYKFLRNPSFPGDFKLGSGNTEIRYDRSENTLLLEDNVILGFGNTTAAPDIYMRWDGTNLDILSTATDESPAIHIGVNTAGIDLTLYGATTGAKVIWDASDDALEITAPGFLVLVPVSADPTGSTEGGLYYDSDDNKFYGRNDSTLVEFGASAGTPAGSDTQIQYNNSSSFGAITNFIWDDTDIVVLDDQDFAFGTGKDWKVQYDEGVDDQLLWLSAATTAGATTDPLYEIIVGASPTADQQVFGIAKGTNSLTRRV